MFGRNHLDIIVLGRSILQKHTQSTPNTFFKKCFFTFFRHFFQLFFQLLPSMFLYFLLFYFILFILFYFIILYFILFYLQTPFVRLLFQTPYIRCSEITLGRVVGEAIISSPADTGLLCLWILPAERFFSRMLLLCQVSHIRYLIFVIGYFIFGI